MELLSERPAKIIFKTALPLLLYSCMLMAFQFFDVLTVSKIDQDMVSTVLFVGDIQNVIDTLFISMSVGMGIRISQLFGANDFHAIRQEISTVFFTVLFISLLLVITCVPFARNILQFCSIPSQMLTIGSTYFSISIFSCIFSAINSIFFAFEKSRGRTKIVSGCNIFMLIIKLAGNITIMYAINSGIISKNMAVILLPLTNTLSQFLVRIIALIILFRKDSLYRVSLKHARFTKDYFLPYFRLTLPIMAIRFINSSSKVICNAQYAVYGSVALAAFACCNKICSLVTTPLEAFQDAETTIMAASLGNHDYDRVKQTLKDSFLLMFSIVIFLFLIVSMCSKSLIGYFANDNIELSKNITTMYKIERLDFLFMALDGVCSAYLFAIKNTRIKTLSSFLQKYAFRIPLLYVLINIYKLGVEAIALAILFSNIATAIFTFICFLFIKHDYETKLEKDISNDRKLIDAIKALARLDSFDETKAIPADIIEVMAKHYESKISLEDLYQEYRYGLVEARIEQLEKQENIYSN